MGSLNAQLVPKKYVPVALFGARIYECKACGERSPVVNNGAELEEWLENHEQGFLCQLFPKKKES
jgi:hypothetical protein